MKLRLIRIRNLGAISDAGLEVEIDRIVVLIGPNNVGKSTVLDAYEAFASVGAALPLERFRDEDPANTIEIEGLFTGVTDDDIEVIGQQWPHADAKYGTCVRVMWRWEKPGEKGEKFSWDPGTNDWVPGGVGGWNTLITSRIPAPLRVRPTDDPQATEDQIVQILTAAAKESLKADTGRAAEVRRALEKLAEDFAQEISAQLTEATEKVQERFGAVFPGYSLEFSPGIGKFEPEKMIGSGSHIRVGRDGQRTHPLTSQGAGVRRTFLWSALGALAELGRLKQGKKTLASDRPRILLIEEPESFLHPPLVRAARETLYGLADLELWQVLTTTHSPVFIDVAKPHTTIVRVSHNHADGTRVFSSDRAKFTDDERANLRMIRSCHPTVSEFFFADNVWLVEGETEHAVLVKLLRESDDPRAASVAVVNCMGKANLPLFARILNQFRSGYVAIHDVDRPFALRDHKWIRNGMWTMNSRIRDVADDAPSDGQGATTVAHLPDFEGEFFGTSQKADKPWAALQTLDEIRLSGGARSDRLDGLVAALLDGEHDGIYTTIADLERRVAEYVTSEQPEPAEAWCVEMESDA